jgi:hypothetical protein
VSNAGPRMMAALDRPTPEQVTAEQFLITGRIYQPLDAHTRPWGGGFDEALNWALGGE